MPFTLLPVLRCGPALPVRRAATGTVAGVLRAIALALMLGPGATPGAFAQAGPSPDGAPDENVPVCLADADAALGRFLSAYVEDLRALYATRSFDPRAFDGVVYRGMEPAAFHAAVRMLVALQGEAAFIVLHLDPAQVCAFVWVAGPLAGAPEGQLGLPEAPVRFAYARRPLERAQLLSDARRAVEATADRIPLSESRTGQRIAPGGMAEVTRGVTPVRGRGADADVSTLLARVAAHLAMPEVTRALHESGQVTLHLPGELAFLPLLALPLDGVRPLVETHAVTAIDRLTALLTLPGINSDEGLPIDRAGALLDRGAGGGDYSLRLMAWSGGTSERLAVLGDPEVLTPAAYSGISFAPLPGARHEAEELARRFDADLVLGPEATRARMLRMLGSSTVLHFAGHGVGSAVDPLDTSYLVLADGPLTARDIQNEMLRAPLVILSACDTGRGQALGAGVIGLARAFQHAGAIGTVLSHWPVSDHSAVPLMLTFHDELTRNPPAEALRRAALRLRRDHPHPADWAAFGYFGTPLIHLP